MLWCTCCTSAKIRLLRHYALCTQIVGFISWGFVLVFRTVSSIICLSISQPSDNNPWPKSSQICLRTAASSSSPTLLSLSSPWHKTSACYTWINLSAAQWHTTIPLLPNLVAMSLNWFEDIRCRFAARSWQMNPLRVNPFSSWCIWSSSAANRSAFVGRTPSMSGRLGIRGKSSWCRCRNDGVEGSRQEHFRAGSKGCKKGLF